MLQLHAPVSDLPDDDLRLLVVSDDRTSRQHLVTLARRSGYGVIDACEDGEALAIVHELRPDFIVVDGPTPALESIDLVRQLRADSLDPQPYILLITSREDDRLLAAALAGGVDEVIRRPLRPRIMALRLQTGHRIVRLQRENDHRREEIQRCAEALRRSNRRLRELALTDELTGLSNRRYAMEHIQLVWAAATRSRFPLSCVVVDLDGLSEINERYGHERGDVVLKTVAAVLRERAAPQEIVCRIGGDEFLIICPEAPLEQAANWAKALVNAVDRIGIGAQGFPLGLSLGVAERQSAMADPAELISLAEQQMYRAKRLGKNLVCVAKHSEKVTAE